MKLSDVILRDTLANRPAAGTAGRLFYDTTNSILYRDNGSTWDNVESGATSGLSGGTPGLTLGTSNSGGSASTGIRTDATIAAFDTTAPVTQAFGDAAAVGSATVAARRDHKHGMPSAFAVRKSADQTVTSSTTLVNDNHLTFSIAANDFWVVRYVLKVDGATAGDIKTAVTAPSGATGWMGVLGDAVGASAFDGTTMHNEADAGLAVALGTGTLGAGAQTLVLVEAYVANSTNAGSITLQWAQNSSSGTATTVYTGSFLIAFKVS